MTTTTTLIAGTRDLIALVPYQLGYQPANSLVVISLRALRGRVGLIARIDTTDTDQAAASLVEHLRNDQADRIAVVIYDGTTDQATGALATLNDAASAAGLPIFAAWHVTGPTYTTLTGPGAGTTPQTLAADTTVVAATMVAAGVAIAPTRADLDITAASPARRAAATRAYLAVSDPSQDRAVGLLIWRAMREDATVTSTAAGTLAAYLLDREVRDAVMLDMVDTSGNAADALLAGDRSVVEPVMDHVFSRTAGTRPGPHLHTDTDTLRKVCALHDNPAARSLLALAAWWAGDGAQARIHADAALDLQPGYRLAELIDQTIAVGMGPGWVDAER